MSLWDSVRHFLAIEPLQERSIDSFIDHPGLTEQLLRVQGLAPRPWRVAGLQEALGVPAIFRAVSLIANTTGSLSLKGYRNGLELLPDDRPRVMVRPDPFRTPRVFFRDTAWNIATRGEAWWWVAKRDGDDSPLSLLNIPPHEVNITENPRDLRYPEIQWRGVTMRNEDMRQITFVQEPGNLRGLGPLQMCGAAISVAVEAQEWAANFFADGGIPSIVIKSAVDLDPTLNDDGYSEADVLRNQWVAADHNVPRVIDGGIEEIKEFGTNSQGAQMLQARDFQIGEVARMFGMPGSLLDYGAPGSSLTYQNIEGEFTKWVRSGLLPGYLEGIEQEMSDLLTRSTVARFNVDALERADIKTRYEVYSAGITAGVLDIERAQRMEGIVPGDIENAPVAFSPPQAVPSILPIQQRSLEVRCDGVRTTRRSGIPRVETCGRLLSRTGMFVGQCQRCHKVYEAATA